MPRVKYSRTEILSTRFLFDVQTMSSPQNPLETSKTQKTHETGALAAWFMILGLVVGAGIGYFLDGPVTGAVCAGTVGWFTGALIERSRL